MLPDLPTVREIDVLLERLHRMEGRCGSGALVHKMKSASIAVSASLLKLRRLIEDGRPSREIASQVKKTRLYMQGLQKYGISLL